MTKGGVVMDVVNADQARIAEEAGVRSAPWGNVNHTNGYGPFSRGG